MKGCRVLTAEEVRSILDSLPMRDRVLMLTGLTFGTRISETLELKFGDFHGGTLYVRSKKNSENEGMAIPETFRQELEKLRAHYQAHRRIEVNDETFLFQSQMGHNKPITRQQASNIIRDAAARLNLSGKINNHSLRKNFVTRIYEMSGRDIAVTKKYSRHKSLASLDYYLSTTDEMNLTLELAWA